MFRIILPLLTAIVAASALLFQSGPATATGICLFRDIGR